MYRISLFKPGYFDANEKYSTLFFSSSYFDDFKQELFNRNNLETNIFDISISCKTREID